MPRTHKPLLLSLALAAACGPAEPPTQEQVDAARSRLSDALVTAERAKTALEILGILPTYTCGERRSSFIAGAVESVQASVGCAQVSTAAEGANADAVLIAFPQGCTARGHTLNGTLRVVYNGGEDRMDVSADAQELLVDGAPLRTQLEYGTCGDERYVRAVTSTGTASLDVRLKLREGLPILGGTTLILDGTGESTRPAGTDRVTSTALEYEVGDLFPRSGELLVEAAGSTRVRAKFSPALFMLGKVELQVDDHAPVTVPLVR